MAHITHEQFIQSVRDCAVAYAKAWTAARGEPLTGEQLARVEGAKLVYGRGQRGLRGITAYAAWQNGSTDEFIEVCALGEESWVQLAGTTIHELGHAATGIGHGHGKEWKRLSACLGLRRVHAAGTFYMLANFAPELRYALAALPKPTDGEPAMTAANMLAFKLRGCTAGQGVRGGKARGPGSGSRLRKYVCDVCGQIIRASTDTLTARHLHEEQPTGTFVIDGAVEPAQHANMAAALTQLFGGTFTPAEPPKAQVIYSNLPIGGASCTNKTEIIS